MLNVLSLFSGIGAFEKALANLGIPYNLLAYCEIDKYASKSYSVIHDVPEGKNLHDVTKVTATDVTERVDLITYGFPCQDISVAGKQKGFTDENGERTRSGLFFEALRIIEDYKPKFAIAENVKALTGKKFKEEFRTVLESLENAGYVNYWQVLNAKDYGIPQNRDRVFIISIRKDIDKGFKFPDAVPLELRLKDMLDDEVDEKFYLSDNGVNYVLDPKRGMATDINPAVCQPLTANGQNNWTGSFISDDIDRLEKSSVIGDKTPVIIVMQDGRVLVREATKKGYSEAIAGDSINLEQPNSKTRRGRVGKEIAQTLMTSCYQAVVMDE